MNAVFCIDDTDILNSERGTGELSAMLIKEIQDRGWGTGSYIVRHQLFVHPDVPYTSHNSSMSFTIELNNKKAFEEIINFAGKYLEEMSEKGSDPGLCAFEMEGLKEPELLMAFGKDAKTKVLNKSDAYSLAKHLGIHLSEHGGTGQGVIGALAGTGLRLSGTDGRVRGKHLENAANRIITVGEILEESMIDLVVTADGLELGDEEIVVLGNKVKSIYRDGRSVLLARPCQQLGSMAKWETCSMEYIKSITG